MNFKFKEWNARTANKDHVCIQCNSAIHKGDRYTCITVKTNLNTPAEQFDSIKIHNGASPGNSDCINAYLKDHAWFVDGEGAPSTSIEVHAFEKLLKSLEQFHSRWDVERSNNLADRINLMTEENGEFKSAMNTHSNVSEELGDMLGVVLGNILWARSNEDETLSIYGVIDQLAKKLDKRVKFGYKIRNKITNQTKMTHWQKVLKFLENERSVWEVLSGPKYIHPEIRELLTEKEIEWLEKTGV